MSRQKKPLDEYESAGPMTRQRLKRQREGSEEDIWGNRNKGNKQQQEKDRCHSVGRDPTVIRGGNGRRVAAGNAVMAVKAKVVVYRPRYFILENVRNFIDAQAKVIIEKSTQAREFIQ